MAVGWVEWRSWEGERAADVGIERKDIVEVCNLMLYSHFQVVLIEIAVVASIYVDLIDATRLGRHFFGVSVR
jgi:hypothetical protein